MDKNNKSFVELSDKEIEEKVIDTLNQYKYIEPKKKLPIKNILLFLSIIIIIILIIIFLKIQDSYNKKDINIEENITTTTNITTTSTTTITTKQTNNEPITETLNCFSSKIENNIEIKNTYSANFYNNSLRSDVNTISMKLLNTENEDDFQNNIMILKLMIMSMINDQYNEVNQEEDSNNYLLSISTTYNENMETNNNFIYGESLESVKQKITASNYICN